MSESLYLWETIENITHFDLDEVELLIDKKHREKCKNDIFSNMDLKNLDYRDILLMRKVFELGYNAAHVDIQPDKIGREDGHYRIPFYRD